MDGGDRQALDIYIAGITWEGRMRWSQAFTIGYVVPVLVALKSWILPWLLPRLWVGLVNDVIIGRGTLDKPRSLVDCSPPNSTIYGDMGDGQVKEGEEIGQN